MANSDSDNKVRSIRVDDVMWGALKDVADAQKCKASGLARLALYNLLKDTLPVTYPPPRLEPYKEDA